MRVWVAGLLDVVGVVVFVAIGRASHDESGTLGGIVSTAWPFLVGLAIGWALARAWRRPWALFPAGLVVWAMTVAGGMTLRAATGQGTALAFVIVAASFLALVLLGWRSAARLMVRPAAA